MYHTNSFLFKQPLNRTALSAPKPARLIPAMVRRIVWQRDRGQCSYVSPLTGQRCDCRRGLEIDHKKSFALGGKHELENLRLLCRSHNQLHAIEVFGEKHMEKYLKG